MPRGFSKPRRLRVIHLAHGSFAATFIPMPVVLAVNGVLVSVVAIYFFVKSHGVKEL